jgi:hypothetical protein
MIDFWDMKSGGGAENDVGGCCICFFAAFKELKIDPSKWSGN